MANVLRWAIVPPSAAAAGYMMVDGVRALTRGDYITPRSGRYAGQLGPWTRIVSAVGIEPRSTLMMTIFVVYGAAWLAIAVAVAIGAGGERLVRFPADRKPRRLVRFSGYPARRAP